MNKTGFIYHTDYLKHNTGPLHPESPQRLTAIMEHLERGSIMSRLVKIDPHPADRPWIERIHPIEYIEEINNSSPSESEGLRYLDPDTPISFYSYKTALLAVGGLLTAVDKIMDGDINNAFCAIRPPGHHAEPRRAMGFCLFNNIAVAARYIQIHYLLKKILIIDWDAHHGNGTQDIFYDDPTVMYFSIHQYPHYPGTGSTKERGVGKGDGFTINVPMQGGVGDKEYIHAFEERLRPTAEVFEPDFILISAGFDAHIDDPLAGMKVTDEGFGELTRIVKGIAKRYCDGRIVSALEGGYNLNALARSVERHLSILID
ncbi:MAG: histone deacetylase [Nitrospinae bacterium]|nr:histone deacetylase [Nitrospinota bacterium]